MFVDRVEARLEAGNGGNGAMSFHHEKFKAKGGPDGGDGGHGGDVVLVASNNENTLAKFRYKKLLKAADGGNGSTSKKHGRNGEDLLVKVPVGTVVHVNNEEVADLSVVDQMVVIARGGKGGFGNAHFVSSTRQAPRVAEKGEKGHQLEVTLELKMIADVGIIGLPNAGKSTLLSVISNAKPQIANYPFTTIHPNLGVVDVNSKNSLLFADIPGLIEGASKGKGLGDEFLRHIERTGVLLHLVDVYGEDIAKDIKTINKELQDYKIDLSKKQQVIALNKIEGLSAKEIDAKLKQAKKAVGKSTQVVALSALSKVGVDKMLSCVLQIALKQRSPKTNQANQVTRIGLMPDEDAWTIEKTYKGYIVRGIKIERFASRTRFDDYHGQERFRDIMRKMGITNELENQGIEPGQLVQIGQPEVANLEF